MESVTAAPATPTQPTNTSSIPINNTTIKESDFHQPIDQNDSKISVQHFITRPQRAQIVRWWIHNTKDNVELCIKSRFLRELPQSAENLTMPICPGRHDTDELDIFLL